MLLAPLLCAALAWQEPAPAPPTADGWQRVTTFGRLLAGKLSGIVVQPRALPNGDASYSPSTDAYRRYVEALEGAGGGEVPSELGSIASASGGPAGTAGMGSTGAPGGGDSSFSTTLRYLLADRTGGSMKTATEHVPGMGSIVSLSLHLPIEALPSEPGGPAIADPAAAATNDDAEWEAAAPPEHAANTLVNRRWLAAVSGASPSVRYAFAKGSLDSLRATTIEVITRFGPRLELGRGEQLAIVVRVEAQATPSQLFGAARSEYFRELPTVGALFGAGGVTTGAGGASGGGGGGTGTSAPGGGGGMAGAAGLQVSTPQLPAPLRLVCRVDGAALAELRAGRITAAAFAARLVASDH